MRRTDDFRVNRQPYTPARGAVVSHRALRGVLEQLGSDILVG